ncbi:MAG: TatD family hydrolase, partial [Burkholderiaceae bacterium]|nr:TatD family hydrolase [Burkholderiaceae bacterium]
EPDIKTLVKLADHPKVVAIGETGLDFYRHKGDLEWQRIRFRTQIRAAKECGKPLIIHARQAREDTLRIMREEGAGTDKGGPGGVMHCFTDTLEMAQAALDMGFYISFSGVITYKSNQQLRDVASQIPMERILIETDSPYLSPEPYRGKDNEPANVRLVAKKLAEIKKIPLGRIGYQTTENFFNLFNVVR